MVNKTVKVVAESQIPSKFLDISWWRTWPTICRDHKAVTAVRGIALHWSTLYWTVLECTVLHCTALYCAALHCRCSQGCSTNTFVIDWLPEWPFSPKLSKHLYSQTVRARELIFWENVHPPPCVTYRASRVRFQVSGARCPVSCVTCNYYFLLYKVFWLVGGGSVIIGAYTL